MCTCAVSQSGSTLIAFSQCLMAAWARAGRRRGKEARGGGARRPPPPPRPRERAGRGGAGRGGRLRRLEVLLAVELEDAEVDVREGELVPRDGERARELCLGGLHLLRLDEQLAVVVEHVGGVGEGRLSVGEDTARLGRLLRAVQRHAELDARQDRAGVELHRLAQVVHCRRDLGLQDVELA